MGIATASFPTAVETFLEALARFTIRKAKFSTCWSAECLAAVIFVSIAGVTNVTNTTTGCAATALVGNTIRELASPNSHFNVVTRTGTSCLILTAPILVALLKMPHASGSAISGYKDAGDRRQTGITSQDARRLRLRKRFVGRTRCQKLRHSDCEDQHTKDNGDVARYGSLRNHPKTASKRSKTVDSSG